MAFLLSTDERDNDVVNAFRRYNEYLTSVRDVFPPSAFMLATSDWYFNPRDHRCPHDAWLENLSIFEVASGKRAEKRFLSMKMRLLGAYHDGHIELHYPRVFAYALDISDGESGHRNWRYDEFRLSDRGYLIHEIEWWGPAKTGLWIIEASDLKFCWIPKDHHTSPDKS